MRDCPYDAHIPASRLHRLLNAPVKLHMAAGVAKMRLCGSFRNGALCFFGPPRLTGGPCSPPTAAPGGGGARPQLR